MSHSRSNNPRRFAVPAFTVAGLAALALWSARRYEELPSAEPAPPPETVECQPLATALPDDDRRTPLPPVEEPSPPPAPRMGLDQALLDADLVCEAVCIDVRYRLSDDAERPLPLTYITLDVQRVYFGKPLASSTLVLRRLGGMHPDGLFLSEGHRTRFRAGDREILFLKRFDDGLVRPVLNPFRRILLMGNRPLTDTGRCLLASADGKLSIGPCTAEGAAYVSRLHLQGPSLRVHADVDEFDRPVPEPAAALDEARLVDLLRARLSEVGRIRKRPVAQIESVDVFSPFVVHRG